MQIITPLLGMQSLQYAFHSQRAQHSKCDLNIQWLLVLCILFLPVIEVKVVQLSVYSTHDIFKKRIYEGR